MLMLSSLLELFPGPMVKTPNLLLGKGNLYREKVDFVEKVIYGIGRRNAKRVLDECHENEYKAIQLVRSGWWAFDLAHKAPELIVRDMLSVCVPGHNGRASCPSSSSLPSPLQLEEAEEPTIIFGIGSDDGDNNSESDYCFI